MWQKLVDKLLWSGPIHRIRMWRYALPYYRPDLNAGQVLFALMMAAPLCMLGAIVSFAWQNQQRLTQEQQRIADLTCLAQNLYHEARGEPEAGQRAVAEVTMNRVASGLFPATVCEVVYSKYAFSWTELGIPAMPPRGVEWERAVTAAEGVYDAEFESEVGDAMHYHATYVAPEWARDRLPLATIGQHVFYE